MRLSRRLLGPLGKPSEFEARYLRENPDVHNAVNEGIFKTGHDHYLQHGKSEGRKWGESHNPIYDNRELETTTRAAFASRIENGTTGRILEIGPLNMPIIKGPRCEYFDILPTEELKEKAMGAGLDSSTVPRIHYWHQYGDLTIIEEKFQSIVSAHCIEHQADLIKHLNQVSSLLTEKGKYFLVIPDQRYCFDHFLPPSRIMEIISAHYEKRQKPTAQSIVEHHTFVTHNDPVKHWRGDHGSQTNNVAEKWKVAQELVASTNGTYVDVHCWQFQPESFMDLIDNLYNLGFISLKCIQVFSTARNNLEFFAILEKN